MVSCETPEQAAAQHALGRRTFRATHDTTALLPGEIVCSADAYGITCEQCLGCDGANRPGASYVVEIHGAKAKRFKGRDLRADIIASA